MPTFADLLTEYMARTGIGDAELARRIQVSRLTLIRWREGVTSRPRYREDVVRCAGVLRLTPEETNGLLLAAGFGVDNALAVSEASASPDDAAVSPPASAQRSLLRRGALIVGVIVLAVAAYIGLSYAIGLQGRPPDHPVALAGESLIVMAPFINYTAGRQGFNVRRRLKEEIDREVQAAGLANVRTADWPDAIPTGPDAVDAGVRSHASIVIWGEYDSGRVMAAFTVPPLRQARGSHGPTVVDISSSPVDLPTTINLALTEEVSSIALMTLGQLYLAQGEHDLAKRALSQALTHQSIDTNTLANLRFRLGRAYLGGKYADLDEAVWLFTQVLAVEPRSVDTLNNRALAYLDRGRDGDVVLAVEDLTQAVSLDPRRASTFLNRAVAYLESTSEIQLSRALDDLGQAIDIDPDYASAYLLRDGEGDLKRAFEDINKALDIDPELAAAYVNRGNAYLQRGGPGDLERADQEFTRAIETVPDYATAYYNRGLVLSTLLTAAEGLTQSTSNLRRAQELVPRDFAFNNTLCWQLAVQRLGEQALPYCEVALSERPEGIARDSRGLVYAVLGRSGEAVADFQAFLAWVDQSQKETCRSLYQSTRAAWVKELKVGNNPFDADTLWELRVHPVPPAKGEPC